MKINNLTNFFPYYMMKLKIKFKKKKGIIAWIPKKKDIDERVKITFDTFKDDIKLSKWSTIFRYYIVSSKIVSSKKLNIMRVFLSHIQDFIMEYLEPSYINEELNFLDDPMIDELD